jgi:hypothetical protein
MRDIRQRFWAWNSVGLWVLIIMAPPFLGCLWIGFQALQFSRAQNEFKQLLKGDPNARITELAFERSVQVNGRWERKSVRIDDTDAMQWLTATARTARRPGGVGTCHEVWARMSSGGMVHFTIHTTDAGEVNAISRCRGLFGDSIYYDVTPPSPAPAALRPLWKG